MSEAILGVLIGGFLGIGGSLIVACLDYKKWQKTEKINILRKEEERLEKKYDEERKRLKNIGTIGMMAEQMYGTDYVNVEEDLDKVKNKIKKEVDNF